MKVIVVGAGLTCAKVLAERDAEVVFETAEEVMRG
jgi:ribulose 1,5-bisphosphate synthetase/thiazole synthase